MLKELDQVVELLRLMLWRQPLPDLPKLHPVSLLQFSAVNQTQDISIWKTQILERLLQIDLLFQSKIFLTTMLQSKFKLITSLK